MNIMKIGGSWVNLDSIFMANLTDNKGNLNKPFIFSGSLSGGKTFHIDVTPKEAVNAKTASTLRNGHTPMCVRFLATQQLRQKKTMRRANALLKRSDILC